MEGVVDILMEVTEREHGQGQIILQRGMCQGQEGEGVQGRGLRKARGVTD